MSTLTSEGHQAGFNLLDRPWIPCLTSSGESVLWSARDVLTRAAQIVVIEAELPTVTFAIHRLLAAILYRVFGLDDEGDPQDTWMALWRSAELPTDAIDDYLHQVHHRFDLLDPAAPFYQVADLHTARNEFSGLEKIIADVPNGSPYFTTRAGERVARIDLAEAARWLVHCQAFDPSGIKSGAVGDPRVKGGKGYPIGTAWAGSIGGLLIEGASLRETLLLNLPLGRGGGADVPWSLQPDRPVWEREPQTAAEECPGASTGDFPGRAPEGPADLLTWQSRRVRLRVDAGGVTGAVIANGDPLGPQNRYEADPMTGWRYSEPQSKKYKANVYMPRQHDPDRAMWRGLGTLLPDAEAATDTADGQPGMAPPNLIWLRTLQRAGHLPDIVVRLRAIGMVYGSNNSVVDDIYDDALRLHSILVSQRGWQSAAIEAVRAANDAVYVLGSLARNLDVAAGGDGAGARSRIRVRAFFALDAAFREWVVRLDPQTDPGAALTQWMTQARELICEIADEEIKSTSPAAWRGRSDGNRHVDVGLASRWFTRELTKILPVTPDVAQAQEVS